MKKQMRMLSDAAAFLAVTLVLTVALLPAGLSGAEEVDGVTEEDAVVSADNTELAASRLTPQSITYSAAYSKTALWTANKGNSIEATVSEKQDEDPVPEETTTSQTTTAPPQTQQPVQTTAPPQSPWTEQETSGVMYVNTDGIYSREVAVMGSAKVKQYELNETVTVIAVTDTGYYKLEDGTFIHTDYLSDSETVTTAAPETEPADGHDDNDEETETEAETAAEPDTDTETGTETAPDVEVYDDAVPLSAQPDVQSMAQEMFRLVNEYRGQHGLPALQWDYNSYPAAQIRAGELLQRNSHTRPGGGSFSTVYSDVGYSPSSSGENIVYYYSNASSAFNSLISSASHRELILSTNYTHISIAYTYDPNSYWGYYWVQEFTTP